MTKATRPPALLALLFGLSLPLTQVAQAATSAPSQSEINSLLQALQTSGCQFNRNGSWYTAAEARDHMSRKVEYIENHGGFKSTETFIELVATKSSMSGQAYQVRCGQAPAMPSAQWMAQTLKNLRRPKSP